MRFSSAGRALAVLIVGLLTAGCAPQAPSDVPAVDTLVRQYDQRSGVWPTTGWWNNANALTALINYMILTDDQRYVWVVQTTYAKKRNAARGNFINDYVDDTGWWALAWIRAYDLTGDSRYLNTAQRDVDFMWQHHDDACGGGLWWTVRREYKNAIANELFIKAAAELAERLGPNRGAGYLERAVRVWNWFDSSGMINDDGLVNDGLDPSTCANNGQTTWTYNQGTILGGLVALATATGEEKYLERARVLADASATSPNLNPDGVLTEPCEQTGCDVNGPSFKGIYVRNLGELNRTLADHPYSDYLALQASIAYEHNRTPAAEYGLKWAGPVEGVSAASQQSAVDLLVAAQPIETPPTGDGAHLNIPGPAH